jgi:predicted DNA-binding antitoxin AbrB/MazE fold protein
MEEGVIGVSTGVKIMVYRGHVENGVIQLEGSVVLPEGAEVRVGLAASAEEELDPNAPAIEEKLRAIWADVPKAEWERLPADLTEHLDHYIYGTPK